MLSSVISALHDGVSETGISCCHLSCQPFLGGVSETSMPSVWW